MAILNYTTKIDVHKTIGEITKILVAHGAQEISVKYANKLPDSLMFQVSMSGKIIEFQLPARYKGVLRALEKQKVQKSLCTDEQAVRIAWRIIKDWVEAQMAIVEAELADVAEVFLPYAVTKNGQPLYEVIKGQPGQFLLKD